MIRVAGIHTRLAGYGEKNAIREMDCALEKAGLPGLCDQEKQYIRLYLKYRRRSYRNSPYTDIQARDRALEELGIIRRPHLSLGGF